MRPVFRTTGRFVEKPRAPMMLLSNGQRIAPSLVYDFLQSADPIIPAGLTTTKSISANGTYTNSAGLITQGTANVWPLDYSPSTLQPLGRPVWEARTNLLLQSTLPGGGATPTGWSVGISGTSAPTSSIYGSGDGAVAYIQTATAQRPFISQVSTSLSASTTYQLWMYVEAISGSISPHEVLNVVAVPAGASVTFPACSANPSGGTGGFVTTGQLVVQIAISATAGTVTVRAGLGASSNVTGSIKFSRPQLEAGAFPTPFIPTTTVAVTRAADALSLALGSWFNASEGTIVVELIPSTVIAGNKYVFSISDGTTAELMGVVQNGVGFVVIDGGVVQANLNNGVSLVVGTAAKAAAVYKLNDFAVSTNGSAVATDTSGTLPTVTTLRLGGDNASTQSLNGWLRKLYYYPVRLSDNRLIGLSI